MNEAAKPTDLNAELAEVQTHLTWVRGQFAQHILDKHSGRPMTLNLTPLSRPIFN